MIPDPHTRPRLAKEHTKPVKFKPLKFKPVPSPIREQLIKELLLIPNTGDFPDYQKKWFGLVSLGVSKKEAERLCRPKKLDKKQMALDVAEDQARHMRELRREARRESRS